MRNQKPNFFIRIFLFLWKLLSGIRMIIGNLLLIIFIIIIVGAISENTPKPITENAPLFVAPSGQLVDQLSYRSPTDEFFNINDQRASETLVSELIETITHASTDSKVTGLVLKLDYLTGGGMSKLSELGEAINKFKDQDKPVVAYADSFTQGQYYLASFADEIYLHDMGMVMVSGFGVYRNYYKEAADKLSVKFHIFKAGKFKDFVEPYIRNDMSEASREHTTLWLNELWSTYTTTLERQRDLDPGAITRYINNASEELSNNNLDPAKLAKEKNLVDHIGSRIERNKLLVERFGADKKNKRLFKHIGYKRYRHYNFNVKSTPENPNVGLIIASGAIREGHQPEGGIGGDSLAKLLQRARDNKKIKALVIRVDSPGGSAFASEIIRDEILAVQESGKPVFISMGSVAASGGYWIAAPANEIWATPTTITGSIGVFGLVPTLEGSLSRIGVNSDGISTTKLAGGLSLTRGVSKEMAKILQQGVDGTYDRFISHVSESRKIEKEQVNDMAQGRVWTGKKAKELGLVDNLGSLTDVINAAADYVGITTPVIQLIERELSPQEQILKALSQKATSAITNQLLGNAPNNSAYHFLAQFSDLSDLMDATQPGLNHSNYPIKVQCMMCIPP